MTYSFTPFFFHSYPLYATDNDFTRPIRYEIRPTWYAEWASKPKGKWTYRLRLGHEYRLFKLDDDTWGDAQGRTRFRFQARCSTNPTNTIVLSEEALVNTFPGSAPNFISQNQLYGAWVHTWTPHLSSEIGYNYIFRQRATLIEYDHENVLNMVLVVRL